MLLLSCGWQQKWIASETNVKILKPLMTSVLIIGSHINSWRVTKVNHVQSCSENIRNVWRLVSIHRRIHIVQSYMYSFTIPLLAQSQNRGIILSSVKVIFWTCMQHAYICRSTLSFETCFTQGYLFHIRKCCII